MKVFWSAFGFWRLLREISVEEIRRAAELGFTIGITGPSPDDVDSLISGLGGPARHFAVPNRTFTRFDWPLPPGQLRSAAGVDLVVYVTTAGADIPEEALETLRNDARGLTPLIVVRHGVVPDATLEEWEKGPSGIFKKTVLLRQLAPEQVAEQVVPAVLDMLPEHVIPLGRRFPPFRQAAATKLIHETSWANAQFAAVSNLPALIPVIGNLIEATADFLVLTKNQIMLLLKLAAIYGRDLRKERSIYMEILPVVGAALLWRTVARELVALLPGLLGAVPKIVIAFAGTFAVGQAAAYYYDRGHRPPAEVIQSFYARAAERATALLPSLRVGGRTLR